MTEAAIDSTQRPQEHSRARSIAISGTAVVLGVTAAKLLIHLLAINRYGFFRDELYYIACSQHLAWGYVDQPPLIAGIAWMARHIFGDSLAAYRLLPILAGGATVLFTGLLARELGGGGRAQFLAAAAILFAPLCLAIDSFLSMNAFEPVFWVVCAWIAVRIVKGASPRWWLAFGAVAGIGLENKHTMLVFGFAIVAGLLLSGRNGLLRSKWIWMGALIALILFFPNVLWEARHGWPQIEVVRNAQEYKNVHVGVLQFLYEQMLFMHPLALPLWLGGLWWYLRAPEGREFRFLGWAFLIVLATFMVLGGKSYYPLPAYPMLMAAGGVAFEKLVARAKPWRWLKLAYPVALVAGGILTVPFGVPILPVETFSRYMQALPYARSVKTERDATAALPQIYADMFGWENIATTVARVYHELPEQEQAGCAILAGNYGEAGAIDHFGPKLGLPRAISGHNSYFYWGPREYTGACVILFGERAERHKELFGEVTAAAQVSNPRGMPSEQSLTVYVCRKPRAPLAELWPHFKLII